MNGTGEKPRGTVAGLCGTVRDCFESGLGPDREKSDPRIEAEIRRQLDQLTGCTCNQCTRAYGRGQCPGFVIRETDGSSRRMHAPDQVHYCGWYLASQDQEGGQ